MSSKHEIMALIAKTDDPNIKGILIVMLAVLEEICEKIDSIRADEDGLRDAVLNGHSNCHHEHHEWLKKRIASDSCEKSCNWVNEKIHTEEEAKKNIDSGKRKVRDAIIDNIARIAMVASAAYVGWVIK